MTERRSFDAAVEGKADQGRLKRRDAIGGLLLIGAVCLIAYWPALSGSFVLDDDGLITQNKLVAAGDGLGRFWFTTEPADYWPMTSTSFWIEWRLWGLNSTGYHLTNLALHIGSAMLLWMNLRRLAIPGAFLAALVWAVHPVNVESVAWISQRKNTLAMFFCLASVLWYLKAEEKNEGREARGEGSVVWYWLSLVSFLLAMLSKGSVAVLPVVLLGIVWWERGRIRGRDLLRSAPFFVVAVVLTGVNIWFQKHGSDAPIRNADMLERLTGAGAAVWFYLSKAIAPIGLVFIYPEWRIETHDMLWWLPVVAAAAVTVLLWRRMDSGQSRWERPIFFAWCFFCIALAPALGFTDVGFMKYSLVADHYQHIALIGVAALVAGGWSRWRHSIGAARKWIAYAAATALIAVLTWLTCEQARLYADPITLYRATIEKNPDCWLAHYNLANSLNQLGQSEEAVEHYRKARRLSPKQVDVMTNLGVALAAEGRSQEAMDYFQQALRLIPDYAQAQNNMGLALVQVGKPQEAMVYLQRAIELKPDYAEARLNLGGALMALGQIQEARKCFRKALELKPEYAAAYFNLGNAALTVGDRQEAIRYYEEALRLQPNYAEARNNLGGVYLQIGQPRAAIQEFQYALRTKPTYVEARCHLGIAMRESGQLEESIDQFLQVIELRPDYAKGWMELAATYGAAQKPEEAIGAAAKAIELARAQKDETTAKQYEEWLRLYQQEQSKPLRKQAESGSTKSSK